MPVAVAFFPHLCLRCLESWVWAQSSGPRLLRSAGTKKARRCVVHREGVPKRQIPRTRRGFGDTSVFSACVVCPSVFQIRLAQGLLYMGKGLLSINPLHSDRFLIHNVTLGCLCVILHTCLHMRHTILRWERYPGHTPSAYTAMAGVVRE